MQTKHTAHALAAVHAILGSPTRMRMIGRLADGPATLTELAEFGGDLTPSAASSQLRELKRGGIVESTRSGPATRFHLSADLHPVVTATLALLEE